MELNVVVKVEILPKEISSDLEKIQKNLAEIVSEYGKIHSSEIKPIAFGLNSLHATLLLNDKKGGIEKIEEKLLNLEDVSEVRVNEISLI
ncbi:MAG: elongation factor 1-beta [Candidatus Altiarchaeota archaeon]